MRKETELTWANKACRTAAWCGVVRVRVRLGRNSESVVRISAKVVDCELLQPESESESNSLALAGGLGRTILDEEA